jgi:hypothetical protein
MRTGSATKLLAVTVLAAALASLASCHKTPVESGPLYILLTYNGGDCNQNGGTSIVDLSPNQPVIYQGATAQTEFKIDFASCPLAAGNCPVDSPNGRSVNVGAPLSSAVGSTFMYTGMTIDNQPCKGADSMGVRVRPAP